jgi:hypothetical protein
MNLMTRQDLTPPVFAHFQRMANPAATAEDVFVKDCPARLLVNFMHAFAA